MSDPPTRPASECIAVRGVLVHRVVAPLVRRWLHSHIDVRLSSGWRSSATNRRVGGAPRSRHLAGAAVDVTGPRTTLEHLRATARSYGAVEVLQEHDHLHVGWSRP